MSSPKNHQWNPFGIKQWLAWIGATATGVGGLTIFLFVNFETKESFASYKQSQERFDKELSDQLMRIENKIDQMLLRR